ncbi:uncharacterized protein LOC112032426 [Quercus suber]|nr:uncharacterized protein LOC112032426 [Quercus suber]
MEVDAEKVIQGQPWAFDKHLVALLPYDGAVPVNELVFESATFWVQIHNFPFQLLTMEAVLSIRETIRQVSRPKDVGEMKGGNFMRVRVEVDIMKSLCRGRRISWDHLGEGWAAFMYECLPNICYCCGLVLHDNKDCDLWLSSRGSLRIEKQQFGSWIRAPQFNHVKKTVGRYRGMINQGG